MGVLIERRDKYQVTDNTEKYQRKIVFVNIRNLRFFCNYLLKTLQSFYIYHINYKIKLIWPVVVCNVIIAFIFYNMLKTALKLINIHQFIVKLN